MAMNLESADLGLPIEVVDIDTHPEVAAEYGVRSVPTLVLLDGNIQMNRIIGTKTVNQLQEWVK
jgi:thioredoxin 2